MTWDGDELADIDWFAWRLAPYAEQVDLPSDPLDLWLWVAAAYLDLSYHTTVM